MNLANPSTRSRAQLPLAVALLVSLAAVALTIERPEASLSTDHPGDLGAVFGELPYVLPKGFDPDRGGALVIEVFPGGPADQGGVQEGDIVLDFDHVAVTGAAQLTGMIRRLGAGRLASMNVWRNGGGYYTGLMQLSERRNPWRDRDQEAQALPRVVELESQVDRLEADLSELRTRVEHLESAGRAGH